MTHPEQVFDLIVAGSGIAGQVTATAAAEAGLRVVLLEKTGKLGGSSAMSGGFFAFSGTEEQVAEDIADSSELFLHDLLESGGHRNDRALLDAYITGQHDTYRWLKENGVRFRALEISSGQSVPRSHNTAITEVLTSLHETFTAHGGQTRLDHRGVRLVTGPSGVTGIVAATPDGERTFTGRAGVVLATGGFSRGTDLLRVFAPEQLAAIPYGGKGNTGDGLRMAWKLGAGMADMSCVAGTYGSHPDTGEDFHELLTAYYLGAIIVNTRGRRFVDESRSYKVLGREVLGQPDGLGFEIFDAKVRAKSLPGIPLSDIGLLEELGHLYTADSLGELATIAGIDPAGLADTVERYNAAVEGTSADEFDRDSLCNGVGEPSPIDTAPFYAYPAKSLLTSTYCGLTITPSGQVTDVDGEVIEGLYAIGELTGGFHGDAYITGTSLGKGAVFGLGVARHAAASLGRNAAPASTGDTAMRTVRTETRHADVVVVGSGVSGSAAARAAAKRGAKVVLLEKLGSFGGSAALSAGMFWTAASSDAYRRRIPLGNTELGDAVVTDYEDALAELRASGVRVADEPQRDIMSFGTGYSTDIGAILSSCRADVVAEGGETHTSATVTGLVSDGGTVTGVTVRDEEGRLIEYRCGAVVLTTGGFQGARDELTRHIGPNADRLLLRANPGSVGDGLRLARDAGAGGTSAMSTFYGHLVGYPLRRFEAEDYLPYSQYYSGSAILVNLRGERFADETGGDELLNQDTTFQPRARGVLIFDHHVRETEGSGEPFAGLGSLDRFDVAVRAGARHAIAPTLPELIDAVAEWGIDRDNLSATLARYREVAEAGGGAALGIPVSEGARPPSAAPFYALMVQPSITFTFGGLRTNTDGEVLDHDGLPVPGLYAAGADIGGLSNYGYAGGLAPGYITGRWAGRSAAHHASLSPAGRSTVHSRRSG